MDVDRLVDECYSRLPIELRSKPWTCLDHGCAILDTEDKLNAYIAAYGEMHIVKCRKAMQNFPFEDLVLSRDINGDITSVKSFEIYDWGCGQGLGSLVLMQMLRERKMFAGLHRVNLIEPSQAALSRAENWVSQLADFSTDIRCVNRFIPANDCPAWDDIDCDTNIAIHICSNILDIREVGLKWLARTSSSIADKNIYICVGPQFGLGISRISDFHNYLGHPACFYDFAQYPLAHTSRTKHPFGIEAKCFTFDRDTVSDLHYVEQSQQMHIDEYQNGDECIKGILPDSVISAYHNLKEAVPNSSFELFLRPSIGVERPDFVLTSLSNGIVIVNICDDASLFAEEFDRVNAIKEALIDVYLKNLKISTIINTSSYNSIKVGLYFPYSSPADIDHQCRLYYDDLKGKKGYSPRKNPTDYLVKLFNDNCASVLKNIRCYGFQTAFYQEIKDAMLGHWHSYADGDTTMKLTKRQNDLVNLDLPRLRFRGVAGCGKTQIIAHKAVREHIRTGSKVLIVTYNISLMSYIRMRINQVPAEFSTDAFDIINYHQFFLSKAKRYHNNPVPLESYNDKNFFEKYIDKIKANKDQYETIIVDEAQDFDSAWFDVLRKYFLTENGRFILCGDGEQNIYNRQVDLTTRLPIVYGFGKGNDWRNVSNRVSMRLLNLQISALASNFAHKFGLSSDNLKIQESLNIFDYKLKYWYRDSASPENIAKNINWILDHYSINPRDVVVLGQTIDLLRNVDYYYRSNLNKNSMRTFESKEEFDQVCQKNVGLGGRTLDLKAIRRVAKVHFATDVDCIKFATIHSFKGWESKTIILIILPDEAQANANDEDGFVNNSNQNISAQIYTALTRARENLFILNLNNKIYDSFFKTIL